MLEIVNNKEDNGGGCDFPHKIVDLQTKTTVKVASLACDYGLNPFEVLKIFGTQIIQAAAEMQAHWNANHNDAETDADE